MSSNSGVVAEEKLRPTTSISGRALKAENNVMVLPEPGGPHNTESQKNFKRSYFTNKLKKFLPIGLCSASQVYNNDSCLTVSRVGTTISGAATLCVSTSICGTLFDHGVHSPLKQKHTELRSCIIRKKDQRLTLC